MVERACTTASHPATTAADSAGFPRPPSIHSTFGATSSRPLRSLSDFLQQRHLMPVKAKCRTMLGIRRSPLRRSRRFSCPVPFLVHSFRRCQRRRQPPNIPCHLAPSLADYIQARLHRHLDRKPRTQDAVAEIAGLCRRERWRLAVWDIDRGLEIGGRNDASHTAGRGSAGGDSSLGWLASPDSTAILVLQNFHRFLQSAEIVQLLARQIIAGKQNRTFVVDSSPRRADSRRTRKTVPSS